MKNLGKFKFITFIIGVILLGIVVNKGYGQDFQNWPILRDDYRAKASGNWNVSATWERHTGGNVWVDLAPGEYPGHDGNSDFTVFINNGHNVTLLGNQNNSIYYNVQNIHISQGGTLTTHCGTGNCDTYLLETENIIIDYGTIYYTGNIKLRIAENANLVVLDADCIYDSNGVCISCDKGFQGQTSNQSGLYIGALNFVVGTGGGSMFTFPEINCAGGILYATSVSDPQFFCVCEETDEIGEIQLSGSIGGIGLENITKISWQAPQIIEPLYNEEIIEYVFPNNDLNPTVMHTLFERNLEDDLEDVLGIYVFSFIVEALFGSTNFITRDIFNVGVHPFLEPANLSLRDEIVEEGPMAGIATIDIKYLWDSETQYRVFYLLDGIEQTPIDIQSEGETNLGYFQLTNLTPEEHHWSVLEVLRVSELTQKLDENNQPVFENGEPVMIVDLDQNPCGITEPQQINLKFQGYYDWPLPVELLEFKATCQNNTAVVTWKTATEVNNDYFILERSQDMRNFERLAKIDGKGHSNTETAYSFIDRKPYRGDTYYRLTQVDYDGTSETFDVIYINCDNADIIPAEVSVFPNPFRNEINIRLANFEDNFVYFEIYNEMGRICYKERHRLHSCSGVFTIPLEDLRPGMYYLRIVSDTEIFNKRIVKN